MIPKVRSFLLQGIDALPVEIEVDLDDTQIQKEIVVGLPDAAVKESLERVRSAMANTGYPIPVARLLINLAPADVRKEGPMYDLPIAVGVLVASGVIHPSTVRSPALVHTGGGAPAFDDESLGLDPRRVLIAGELALDGRIRPIRGVIAMVTLARDLGLDAVLVPAANAAEASVVEGVRVFGVSHLSQVVGLFNGELDLEPHPTTDVAAMLEQTHASIDFAEVKGQESVKRALVVAAAGQHNIVMLGPAGTGKTMMAKALPGIMPTMTPAQAIEVTRIYSSAGLLDSKRGLISTRPVRTPHHTASSPAIVGGGVIPRAGEISLAHHGILFLDELPEFSRNVLETMRQPMEDHVVTIARSHGTVQFPASFMLVAAMNPTPKGDVAPGEVGQREMQRYLSRLSGPLLDRIDLHVEAPAVAWSELSAKATGTDTATMRAQVIAARERATRRQGDVPNSRLRGKQLDEYMAVESSAKSLLQQAMTQLGLSARAYDKIRRVSLTIADLAGSETVRPEHVGEAVQYRLLDRKL
ncbi:MAG: YifB family Mg chelatase-like AAA ATPase [Phycisphaerales bacterium]|nr:YifB family Mg chelatase-like AAA ATPase [Phycisphaerales bacterium]